MYSVSLAVENNLGCRDTIIKENYIEVLLETDLFIPSAFTPNGDGINDLFIVRGQHLDNYNLQIYNQWGGLLHASQNQEDGWTGYKDGQPINCGTYTYLISWKTPREGTQYTSGHITLLR